tara:strand:+ start:2224 stop:2826 length:603 start_codon:yes stop_codon:yes gene_type:complete
MPLPKLNMEINDIEDDMPNALAEEEYLKRPQKPSSLEKPIKKKRVMSEKQLANLSRAREISAQKRAEAKALKKPKKAPKEVEEEVEEPDELSGAPTDLEEEEEEEYVAPLPKAKKKVKQNKTLIDYDYIMDSVYNRMNREREEQDYMKQEQHSYDENIRKQERTRLMKLVEEKQKKSVPKDAWDACFSPQHNRGNGGNFF